MIAVVQRELAVVNPLTVTPAFIIAPAPRKPTPLTTCATIRPGSDGSLGLDKNWEYEIEIISNFLPSQLSKQEIDEVINKTIKSSEFNSMRDMGKVIKIIKEQYDGMMDFGYVSKVIKEKLSNLWCLIH